MLQACAGQFRASDELNQDRGEPFGRAELRAAVANHYDTIYGWAVDPETQVPLLLTVCYRSG